MNEMMDKTGLLTVISGFSGVGKGTLVKKLLERYPEPEYLSYQFVTAVLKAYFNAAERIHNRINERHYKKHYESYNPMSNEGITVSAAKGLYTFCFFLCLHYPSPPSLNPYPPRTPTGDLALPDEWFA